MNSKIQHIDITGTGRTQTHSQAGRLAPDWDSIQSEIYLELFHNTTFHQSYLTY